MMDNPLDFRLPEFNAAVTGLPAASVGEDYWTAVRGLYATSDQPVNLENGYWGVMAEPVKAMYRHWTDRVNFDNSLLIRARGPQMLESVRVRVAQSLGCDVQEITLTRGATEAMLSLIAGYNRLKPGDTVLYCDLDYPMMRQAMQWLRERRGVQVVGLAIAEPATHDSVLDAYARALEAHPRTRLILLTHLSHSTGLVMPVRELAALAHKAGAEVIVDAAHSWGQLDFDASDLDAPYVAFNLHKWIGAPLGCGCVYIRRGSLDHIDPYFGSREFPADDIRSRIYTGSPNFAAWLTLPAALQLHEHIGAHRKEQRLRALRDLWVREARKLPGVDVLTPDDPSMVAGITSFRVRGCTTSADNDAIVETLLREHGVYTVRRDGPSSGDCIRVTPAIYTTPAQIGRFIAGLAACASRFAR